MLFVISNKRSGSKQLAHSASSFLHMRSHFSIRTLRACVAATKKSGTPHDVPLHRTPARRVLSCEGRLAAARRWPDGLICAPPPRFHARKRRIFVWQRLKMLARDRGALCAGGRCGIMDVYEQNERKDPPEYYFAASPARRADRRDLLVAFARLRRGDDATRPCSGADPGLIGLGLVCMAVYLYLRRQSSASVLFRGMGRPMGPLRRYKYHLIEFFLQRHHPLVQRRAAL